MDMVPPSYTGEEVTPDDDKASYIMMLNLRRLKRLLRDKIPYDFYADELEPFSVWFQCPQEAYGVLWSEELIRRIANQITGLLWSKPFLNIEDIKTVLVRMGLQEVCEVIKDSNSE